MEDYCLFTCSDLIRPNRNAIDFIGIVRGLADRLRIPVTQLGYACADEDDPSLHESRLNDDSIHAIHQISQERTLEEILLWTVPDEKSPGLYLNAELIDSGLHDGYEYACVHFPMELIRTMSAAGRFHFTLELLALLNRLGELDYALITTMESSQARPYFSGIFVPGLSEQEKLNLATWEHKYVERKIRLRGLYWGNLMSASHLARIPDRRELESHLDKIKGCLRSTINGDDLFFMLPSADLSKADIGPLQAFLREHDLLMEPDEEARRIVRSLLD